MKCHHPTKAYRLAAFRRKAARLPTMRMVIDELRADSKSNRALIKELRDLVWDRQFQEEVENILVDFIAKKYPEISEQVDEDQEIYDWMDKLITAYQTAIAKWLVGLVQQGTSGR